MITYFDNTQVLFLVAGIIFFLFSLIFQISNKNFLAISFLFLAGISLFSFSALLDPFLNLWDERFHGLVAKNLMNHPLMPTLYDNPIVKMEYDRWDRSIIWLHKQPLFLWQIALSFKLFGISEFTLRLPSVFLSSILILISYRTGKLLVNQRVGYLSGVLIISSMYFIQLISGRQELEHNDISFLVYVSLSIWSFIEYHYSKKRKWIILIGLFAGLAILCKWLVGLLVYFGWAILKLQQKKIKLYENTDIFGALLVTFIIVIPWQILSFLWYPDEASSSLELNALHFSSVIEGHGGTVWYHFTKFNDIYGIISSFLIIPALYFMKRNSNDKTLFYSLLSLIIIVYLFFSIAATKMPSFTILVFMVVVIAFASLLDTLFTLIYQSIKIVLIRNLVFVTLMILLFAIRFDVEFIQQKHTVWKDENTYTRMMIQNKAIFKSLNFSEKTVLFNVKGRHYIEAMFYANCSAYSFIPSLEQYTDLKKNDVPIAIFVSSNSSIPSYLLQDSSVKIIKKQINGYD